MGTIGKGVMALLTRNDSASWDARVVTMTAIYSGIGLRDDRMNERIREAFMKGMMPSFKRMRRDPHDPSPIAGSTAKRSASVRDIGDSLACESSALVATLEHAGNSFRTERLEYSPVRGSTNRDQ